MQEINKKGKKFIAYNFSGKLKALHEKYKIKSDQNKFQDLFFYSLYTLLM
jgi:hypothetical protein